MKKIIFLFLVGFGSTSYALSDVKQALYNQVYNDELNILELMQKQCPEAMLSFAESVSMYPQSYPKLEKGSEDWNAYKNIHNYSNNENCKYYDPKEEAKLIAEMFINTLKEDEATRVLEDITSNHGRKLYEARIKFSLEQNRRLIKKSINKAKSVSSEASKMYQSLYPKKEDLGVIDLLLSIFE